MINETKKYVINLKKRPDRLKLIMQEFKNIGYNDVELFEGIDTNSHVGCALSHIEIIKKAINDGLENVIIFEDDLIFMPYAKSFLYDLEKELENIEFGCLNLNPSIHRPLNISSNSELLLDLTNRPPKEENHRGIYSTGFILYNKKIFNEMLKYNSRIAIDEFLDTYIYEKYQSYSPCLPICCQRNGHSDISNGEYSSFYIQTYNWNVYCPNKIPSNYTSQEYVLNLNNYDSDYKKILK
jgi:GR25 family glycosyltransferase involved in LPS biosynthesis